MLTKDKRKFLIPCVCVIQVRCAMTVCRARRDVKIGAHVLNRKLPSGTLTTVKRTAKSGFKLLPCDKYTLYFPLKLFYKNTRLKVKDYPACRTKVLALKYSSPL